MLRLNHAKVVHKALKHVQVKLQSYNVKLGIKNHQIHCTVHNARQTVYHVLFSIPFALHAQQDII
jgi:hypothetical protein